MPASVRPVLVHRDRAPCRAAAMKMRRFVVTGRVQSVGFRYFVVREARALGVSGWVRNLSDGTVEVVVAGESGLVDTMEGRLWQGPPHALVTHVASEPADPPERDGFHVLSTPW